MDRATLSALAALSGSALGGVTPLISNFLIQRGQTRRELLSRELSERQTLYADFIQFATKVYVSASTKNLDDVDDLIALYSFVGRIRLFASEPVIGAAEGFASRVTERYGQPALTIEDLRAATLAPHVDPLHEFSSLCRAEMQAFLES